MSQYVETPTRAFANSAALAAYRRVKLSAGVLAYAASTDVELGTLEAPVAASDTYGTVRLRTAQGTAKMVAAGAITAGNPVYAAANGKVDASGTILVGKALETSTTDGDVIEVVRAGESSAVAAAGGTTAAAFLVDSDATTPKIELASQAAGTGDYKATIKPPATLGASVVFTLPDGGSSKLVSDAVQTVTADDSESALNTILPDVHSVIVDAVTNDANDFIVLPALASVPDLHTIRIYGEANSNFEVRTPASSNEKINAQDCDGTKEYLFTKLEVHTFVKQNATVGWVAYGVTALGAAVTPVVPD